MNSKIKSLIILFLIGLTSYSQSNSSDNKIDWELFKDKALGYSIEYPSNWTSKGGKGGFICGKESGFKNAEWAIWLSKTENTERIDFIFNDDGVYEDYDITKKTITINGIEGFHFILTNSEKPNEYIEFIIIKTKTVWYKIVNDGIKDERFKRFYKSFKLLE